MSDNSFASETRQYLSKMLHWLFDEGAPIAQAKHDMLAAAENAGMNSDEWNKEIATAWNELVDKALDDHMLSEDEEHRLAAIRKEFDLVNVGACRTGVARLVQAATLRDLAAGKLPNRFACDVAVPFKLKKEEALLWVFQDVRLLETKIHRSTVGGSTGLSIRVAKGVYWRVGAFKASPVVREEMVDADRGLVFLTNKQVVFSGVRKNLRVPFDSLAIVKPYSDALELQKDNQTAKPFHLAGVDGWFVYNVMQVS